MLRLLLVSAAAATALLTGGCFSERLPPPAFRYACSTDVECGEGERCMNSLCQIPCTQATFATDCNPRSHLACFNGACASVCDLSAPECPSPQACTDLGVDLGDAGNFGICSTPCTVDSCPDAEVCLEGFCIATCNVDDPEGCPDGLACVAGLCFPEAPAPATSTEAPPASSGADQTDTEQMPGSEGTATE